VGRLDAYRQWVEDLGFIAHIRARDEEALELNKDAGFRARRWVVERTHS
jgi:putative transposase